ncbi:MAG: thiamine pyrophosphate-dependent enzyme [Thermomicrobiales bacterium]
MAGQPRFASQDLPDVPYARYAELLGLTGIVVDRPEDVGPAWDRALTSDRPVVIDAIVDANVPTIPPDPSQEIVDKITQALAGKRNRGSQATTGPRRSPRLAGGTVPPGRAYSCNVPSEMCPVPSLERRTVQIHLQA